jgi:sugar phosphate isomerase/epimerase
MVVAGVSPIELWRRFPGRFPLLHLKDFELAGPACTFIGTDQSSAALGHGQIDYRTLLRQAIELGAKHMFVERDGLLSAHESLEAAARDYRYLEAILSPDALRK